MSEICVLDEDNCLALDSISRAFHCGIKEEQTWALVYQSMICLKHDINISENVSLVVSKDLFIRDNGTVDVKSWHSPSETAKPVPIKCVVSSIAAIVYKALEYGTEDDVELIIPSNLEEVLGLMIHDFDADEGIEESEDLNESNEVLDQVINRCIARIQDNIDIGEHYRNVCRALVAEAIEMSTFLNQISKGTKELKKIKNVTNDDVDDIHVELWAHLWMKVMRQLRVGVSLKNTDKQEFTDSQRREYELTPFEMLLNDINSKRYSLKKVISVPKQVEKDARTLILDFIRSRPPLKPVAERKLNPLPSEELSLHQKLMKGIQSPPSLRPSPKPFERKFDSFYIPKGKRYSMISTKTNVGNQSEDSVGNVFQRFSFRNLSLRSTQAVSRNTSVKTQVNTRDANSHCTPIPLSSNRRLSIWDKFCQAIW